LLAHSQAITCSPNASLERDRKALIDLVDGLSSGLVVLVSVTDGDLADHDATSLKLEYSTPILFFFFLLLIFFFFLYFLLIFLFCFFFFISFPFLFFSSFDFFFFFVLLPLLLF
jgi:hypothetical protein